MGKRFVKQLGQFIVTLFGITFLTFCLTYLAPGDPVTMLLETADTIVSVSYTHLGMCGELASDPVATMILLGLGLDEFSMTASSIPLIKNILRSVSKAECEEVANKALTMDTAEEITGYAKSVLIEKGLL